MQIRKKPNAEWKDENFVLAYQLAKSGHTDQQIARVMGVRKGKFRRWCVERPAFRKAIDEGRSGCGQNSGAVKTYKEYVYGHLPEHLQSAWDRIDNKGVLSRKFKTGSNRVSADEISQLLAQYGKRERQQLFIHAVIMYNFNLSHAMRATNVSKRVLEEWTNDDSSFLELLDEIKFHKEVFIETAVMDLVAQRNPLLVKFAAASQLAHKGYGNKKEVRHTGMVEHAHRAIPLEDLDGLSVQQRKMILDALRGKKPKALPPPKPADEEVIEGEVLEPVTSEDD